ncbi:MULTISPECIES: AsmA family protein [Chelativorans]|jgi:AsmA protein|uniref:AsmA n=1 Tax=Chelativorans sp. (strain BNC1) TaxID=266779 RepID=Q11M03_CHESB|nr:MULTISPECIES: AsmA-like C-terminal region-containing protein [Chelativorans]
MPISLAKKGSWAVGTVVLLIVLVVAVLPLIASTRIVRNSIAYQMSAWSGYHVRLDETPEINVWPLQAVLHDVTLLDSEGSNGQTVLDAERIDIDLSALAALRGDIVFTRMRLIRPVLRVRQRGDELQPISPQGWGKVPQSVEAAKQAVSAAPRNPDTAFLPNDSFGKIEFEEGRIVAEDGQNQSDIVTSFSGTLDWPALNRQASLSATGIWHGESISLTASIAEPLILFGGGNTAVSLSLKAPPANLSFEGMASRSENGFVDGDFTLSAPSLSRLVEWTHSRMPLASRIGPFSISARMLGNPKRLKFEQAALTLDKSAAEGLLDVTFDSSRPTVAGTLAFDTLNLRALLDAFNPLSTGNEEQKEPGAQTELDFDLRVSAASATYDNAVLTDVAAAAMVREDLAAFDISDASAFGGTLQFGLRRSNGDNVDISMTGEEINIGEMAAAFGYQRLMPQATGDFSLILKGTGQRIETVLQSADGSVSANLGAGSVPGLSIDAFLTRSEAGNFFPMAALEEGMLRTESIKMKATVSKGVMQINDAEAKSGPYTIGINGFVPLAGRGLALYGTLAAPENTDERLKSPLSFFVGGNWAAPFIASFLPAED